MKSQEVPVRLSCVDKQGESRNIQNRLEPSLNIIFLQICPEYLQ